MGYHTDQWLEVSGERCTHEYVGHGETSEHVLLTTFIHNLVLHYGLGITYDKRRGVTRR